MASVEKGGDVSDDPDAGHTTAEQLAQVSEPLRDGLAVLELVPSTPPELVPDLKRLTPQIIQLLERPDPDPLAGLLGMPLDRFEREGQPLELRVSWWPETLFFVPDVGHAERLAQEEGVARDRCWTASELDNLLSRPDEKWTPEALRATLAVLAAFGDAEVVALRPRADRSAR